MTDASFFRLLNGRPEPAPAPLELRAGPLSLQYDSGTIRYIRFGQTEVIRQVYAAVRDQNWDTIAGRLENLTTDVSGDHFEISFDSIHQQDDIDFRWHGQISGTSAGVVTFTFSGQAHSTFKRNRVGFCILHPMDCAGKRVRIEQVDGQNIDGRFPETIAPHQPFLDIRAIRHEFAPESWAEVRMEGDTFEMEDQRNWTDASFKTYCTPLSEPSPAEVAAGTRIEQKVMLSVVQVSDAAAQAEMSTALTLKPVAERIPLPKIGLGAASHDEPLYPAAVERLRQLRLAHLRVDVHPDRVGWETRLDRIASEAAVIGVPLEIALHLSDEAEAELHAVRQQVKHHRADAARWLIFHKGEPSTSARWIELARQVLGSVDPIFGGTDSFFTELNRNRPDTSVMDGVVYSVNPQVHAFDDATLTETLATQAVTVTSARQFSDDLPLHVGPVTLKMRSNPNATTSDDVSQAAELPSQADVRQMSLFGAGWTLDSIKYLTVGGAAGITYFETTGYMGVMATESGSALPDQFWNIPGGVYPMYHVLADVAEFAGGHLIPLRTSDLLRVDGFALEQGDRYRLLLANFRPMPQTVTLEVRGNYTVRTLDVDHAQIAMRDPEGYRQREGQRVTSADDGTLTLELAPFAVLTLDRVDRLDRKSS